MREPSHACAWQLSDENVNGNKDQQNHPLQPHFVQVEEMEYIVFFQEKFANTTAYCKQQFSLKNKMLRNSIWNKNALTNDSP